MHRLAAIGSRADVVAADDRGAGGRGEKAGDHLHRRRLAGAVGAEKAQHLAARTVNDTSSTAINAPKFLTRWRISSIERLPAWRRRFAILRPIRAVRRKRATLRSAGLRPIDRRPATELAIGPISFGPPNDPPHAAFLGHGDARLCGDASAQTMRSVSSRCQRWTGCCAYVVPVMVPAAGADRCSTAPFSFIMSLALWALWERRTLRLRVGELTQLMLGFAVPFLLARHVVGTRVGDSFLRHRHRPLHLFAVALLRPVARARRAADG